MWLRVRITSLCGCALVVQTFHKAARILHRLPLCYGEDVNLKPNRLGHRFRGLLHVGGFRQWHPNAIPCAEMFCRYTRAALK